jgi:hypothetical protein
LDTIFQRRGSNHTLDTEPTAAQRGEEGTTSNINIKEKFQFCSRAPSCQRRQPCQQPDNKASGNSISQAQEELKRKALQMPEKKLPQRSLDQKNISFI